MLRIFSAKSSIVCLLSKCNQQLSVFAFRCFVRLIVRLKRLVESKELRIAFKKVYIDTLKNKVYRQTNPQKAIEKTRWHLILQKKCS